MSQITLEWIAAATTDDINELHQAMEGMEESARWARGRIRTMRDDAKAGGVSLSLMQEDEIVALSDMADKWEAMELTIDERLVVLHAE